MRSPQGRARLRTFSKVTANPMWNQDFPTEFYETDPCNRFTGARRPPAPPIGAGSSTWRLTCPILRQVFLRAQDTAQGSVAAS
jgi:hypothetical protein